MGEMASLWAYGESNDAELNQKLLSATIELEKLKTEAMEEMRKNQEYQEHVKQLTHLLRCALQERDEARNQFHQLLNKTMPSTTTTESFPSIPLFHSDNTLLKPGKANSSITESNSLSETYNYHSHGSSPVESLFDGVSSPEFSNINVVVNQPLVQESNPVLQNNQVNSVMLPKLDHESLIIDNLAKGRVLPQRGKFLQAVLQAGPLLQTLLVAGPLPRWRNPPQLHQPFQIPPVLMKGCQTDVFSYKPVPNAALFSPKPLNSQPFAQLSCGSAQVQSAPMLSFANFASGNCLSNASLVSSGMNTSYAPFAKRQRFS